MGRGARAGTVWDESPAEQQVSEDDAGPLGPAGTVLTAEDVAGAVYLLCLPEAAMVTGHTLVVDGGFCITG